MQQGTAHRLLQSPDLLAHRRLRAMNPLAGAGETAGIDNRDKAAEQVEIEHGRSIQKSTDYDHII
jgi:hypothetical protein